MSGLRPQAARHSSVRPRVEGGRPYREPTRVSGADTGCAGPGCTNHMVVIGPFRRRTPCRDCDECRSRAARRTRRWSAGPARIAMTRGTVRNLVGFLLALGVVIGAAPPAGAQPAGGRVTDLADVTVVPGGPRRRGHGRVVRRRGPARDPRPRRPGRPRRLGRPARRLLRTCRTRRRRRGPAPARGRQHRRLHRHQPDHLSEGRLPHQRRVRPHRCPRPASDHLRHAGRDRPVQRQPGRRGRARGGHPSAAGGQRP